MKNRIYNFFIKGTFPLVGMVVVNAVFWFAVFMNYMVG